MVRGIVVISYDGVTAILANDGNFAVTSSPTMADGGTFFLGQDDEVAAAAMNRPLSSLIFREEGAADRIPEIVGRLACTRLAKAPQRMDFVADCLRPVKVDFAIKYSGLRHVLPERLYCLTETLFEYLSRLPRPGQALQRRLMALDSAINISGRYDSGRYE